MGAPHFIFDEAETIRYVRDSRERAARFRSEVKQAIESIQPTLVEAKKLIADAKAILDKPV